MICLGIRALYQNNPCTSHVVQKITVHIYVLGKEKKKENGRERTRERAYTFKVTV